MFKSMKITRQYIEDMCTELNEFLKWIDCKAEYSLDDQDQPCVLFTERTVKSSKKHIFYDSKEVVWYLMQLKYGDICDPEDAISILKKEESWEFENGIMLKSFIDRKCLEILGRPTLRRVLINDEYYLFSDEEIMACYRYQTLNYRTEDAKSHIEEFIYGTSKDALTEDEVKEAEEEFEKTYFIQPSCLLKESVVNEVVRIFERDHDCNIAENDLYHGIIMDIANKKWKYDD